MSEKRRNWKADSLQHLLSTISFVQRALLAEKTIQDGGVVFGAALCKDLRVRHMMTDSLKGISQLRGAKYVQSDIGDCYRQVKVFLEDGKTVLFSGTPCQVDALGRFLGKTYDKLLTVDILCHGVPSPAVLRKFVESREKTTGKKAISINFREKDPGWSAFSTSILYEDGTKEIDNSFYYFFVRDFCVRESCAQCLYSSTKRVGDITLGDFWGYREAGPEHIEDDDRGISLVSINNKIGEAAFRSLKGKLDFAARTREEATKSNPILLRPFVPNERAAEFWSDFPEMEWDMLTEKYAIPREKKRDHLSAADRAYYAVPYKKRHMRHLLSCAKRSIIKKLGR